MTLEEVDDALTRLPTSPVTGEDIEARAALTWKRNELEVAAREAEACRTAADRRNAWGLPLANVPGDISCVITAAGRTVYAEIVDGRRVMRLAPAEVRHLSISNQSWGELNAAFIT